MIGHAHRSHGTAVLPPYGARTRRGLPTRRGAVVMPLQLLSWQSESGSGQHLDGWIHEVVWAMPGTRGKHGDDWPTLRTARHRPSGHEIEMALPLRLR